MSTLTRKQAGRALPEWRYLLGRMHLTVDADTFPAACHFVTEVARIAEEHNHHPEIDLRYTRVHLAVASHDVGAITQRDVDFGRAVDRIVADHGLTRKPTSLFEIEIAIDAMDIDTIRPFWQAVTGYQAIEPDELRDPDRIGPTIWFQEMDEPRPQRNRVHLDLGVTHDSVADRLEAALAAGGRLVSDDRAPSYWVLADPEDNEVCLCTWPAPNEEGSAG